MAASFRPGGPLDDRRPLPQRLPPLAMPGIPGDRLGQTLVEPDLRLPAELAPDLRPVEHVSPVVAGPVGDDRLEVGGLAELDEDGVGDFLDALLDTRADVVRL